MKKYFSQNMTLWVFFLLLLNLGFVLSTPAELRKRNEFKISLKNKSNRDKRFAKNRETGININELNTINDSNQVHIPVQKNATIQESQQDALFDQYSGQNNQNWTEPYLNAIQQMGWKIRADLTDQVFVKLFQASSYSKDKETRIIQPKAFIDSVKAYRKIPEKYIFPKYTDVIWLDLRKLEAVLDSSVVKAVTFNEKNRWPEKYKSYARSVITKGKNPGLGVRELHKQGFTGKGITLAIIDQNMCIDHPEYKDKIIEYKDFGCGQVPLSFHGSGVTSLLVGDSIGTAPDAKIYYAAVPSWTFDAKYYADALNWIIDKNSSLPPGEKIRAVSVSAMPSGPNSPYTKNSELWDAAYARAINTGLTVIDCTEDKGIAEIAYYDIDDPDNISKIRTDFPGAPNLIDPNRIFVPSSQRTTAEELSPGDFSYRYSCRAGVSWSVPYLVGVVAMGWQIRPEISGSEMIRLIKESAYKKEEGINIIQPKVFIDAVKAYGVTKFSKHQDVRNKDLKDQELALDESIIKTLTFNEKTIWPGKYKAYAKNLISRGKNPGLGVRELHKQGFTGKGITVAIIDQNMTINHPEYKGKIIEYKDFGCKDASPSMHGPAVTSLLIGDSIGTAPDAKIYYAAAPSWNSDAKNQADALSWIIDKNKTLPEGEKIRAVSISTGPSGPNSPFKENQSLWDSIHAIAIESGLIIIDCSTNNGITDVAYNDIDDPNNILKTQAGSPIWSTPTKSSRIFVPTSLRSVAEEMKQGDYSYVYWGNGGISWSAPYLVGVMAMGWQLRPDISGSEMVRLLKESAYNKEEGVNIIYPKAFIDAVKIYPKK